MRIKCIKSGGFVGQTKECDIDFSELNKDEIDAFNIIRNINLDLNPNLQDGFIYTIEFLDDKVKQTVVVDESTITKNVFKFFKKIDSKLRFI